MPEAAEITELVLFVREIGSIRCATNTRGVAMKTYLYMGRTCYLIFLYFSRKRGKNERRMEK